MDLSAGIMVDGAGVPTGTPLTDPPVIEMISEDPVLRNCKLIAEAWDCDGLNQVGAFPHYGGQWAEWNGHFRDTVRQFVKVCTLGSIMLQNVLVGQRVDSHSNSLGDVGPGFVHRELGIKHVCPCLEKVRGEWYDME